MNPLQLILVFFQLAQQRAKAYTDGAMKNAESTANKVTSLLDWEMGKKPDAYPSADAVMEAANTLMEELGNKTVILSVSGRTATIKSKEV